MDEFLDDKNLFFLSFYKGYKAALSNELIEKEPDRHQDLGYSLEVRVGGGPLWEDNSR
jgi:hypothetical protein